MTDINILKEFKSKLKEMSLEQIEATKEHLENTFKELQAKELGVIAGINECEAAILLKRIDLANAKRTNKSK